MLGPGEGTSVSLPRASEGQVINDRNESSDWLSFRFKLSPLKAAGSQLRFGDTGVDSRAHRWPVDTDFALWELEVFDRGCAWCGRMMHICDHPYCRLFTLDGPVQLVRKLNHCPDTLWPGHATTRSPETEPRIALSGRIIGWDVFCWIGHRRFARHWSIPQIRGELLDSYAIAQSENSVANYVHRYQTMLAARQQYLDTLRDHYCGLEQIILSLDGLQPEKGHETLNVVRELLCKRVWFAEALISASAGEVQRLIALAKQYQGSPTWICNSETSGHW